MPLGGRGSTTLIHPLATLAGREQPRSMERAGGRAKTCNRDRTRRGRLRERRRALHRLSVRRGTGGGAAQPSLRADRLDEAARRRSERHDRHGAEPSQGAARAAGLDAGSEPVPLRVADPVLFVLNLAVYLDGLVERAARALGVSRGDAADAAVELLRST